MEARKPRSLEILTFVVALVVLVLDTGGGPGWGTPSAQAVLAVRLDHLATSPLYDLMTNVAVLVPIGEPGFRLGVLDAVLAAGALAGVVAAVRGFVPRESAAAIVPCALLLLAAPFRDAAAFASPSILAASGSAWAIAHAARFARHSDPCDVSRALGACALVVGSTPWLGAGLTLVVIAWLWRAGAAGDALALCFGGLGLLVVVLWFSAIGTLPAPHVDLAALEATGRGDAAILVGAGLLGVGFGALTGLPHSRWLALITAMTVAHEAVFGGSAAVVLVVLAVGGAIVSSAIVRVAAPKLPRLKRQSVALVAGLPLMAAALVVGPTITIEDPGATPAQLASDLVGGLPPGPGLFVSTRPTSWLALQYEMTVAGARPDLALVPPLPPQQADALVANALRDDRVVGADAAAFGRLDVRRAAPRRRGFQLVGAPPWMIVSPPPPARYPTRIGREQATLLALERARHEAASGRLADAARALALEPRFGAADLAVLATTLPTAAHPALFGFLPLDERPPGPWLYDLFGDDLAWVAGLPVPAVDASAPMARRLHAKWREIVLGKAKPDDPAITAMGHRAVQATKELFER